MVIPQNSHRDAKKAFFCLLLDFFFVKVTNTSRIDLEFFFPFFFFFSPLQIPPPASWGRKCRISFQGGVSGSDFGVGFVLSTKKGELEAGGRRPQ